jgi:uncharacterized protein (TIGR02266 family)
MADSAGQKKQPRAVVSLSVKYGQEGNSQAARALNLSPTGMLIETKSPVPLSERVSVSFKIPETEEMIQADGEVVWVNKYCANYPYGMAIKFVGLQEKTARAIGKYVRKVLESPSATKREDIIAIPD